MSADIQRRPLPGITTLIEKFPLILFFALLVWLSLQSPFFLSWQNISMMLVQSVPLAILCFGLVCVIAVGGDDVVSGGIDLSLPAIAVLGVALLSLGMAEWNTPYLALILLLVAVSLACGAVNAVLVLAAGLPPASCVAGAACAPPAAAGDPVDLGSLHRPDRPADRPATHRGKRSADGGLSR